MYSLLGGPSWISSDTPYCRRDPLAKLKIEDPDSSIMVGLKKNLNPIHSTNPFKIENLLKIHYLKVVDLDPDSGDMVGSGSSFQRKFWCVTLGRPQR